MKTKIVNAIREKFILGFPEGKLLEEHDWDNMDLTDYEKEKYRRYFSTERDSGYMATDRKNIKFRGTNPLSILTELYFKTEFERKSRTSDYYEDYYEKFEESTYKDKVLRYFRMKSLYLKAIILKSEEIIGKMNIKESDLIIVNVGKRTYDFEDPYGRKPKLYNMFKVEEPSYSYNIRKHSNCREVDTVYADVFIISNDRFRKISIAPGGVIENVEQLIKRDIKRTNIYNNMCNPPPK